MIAKFWISTMLMFLIATSLTTAHAENKLPEVTIKVVQGGESHLSADKCRKMIVGPGVNQPDPFPGYNGMVGWSCPVRLRDGTMYVTFSAGYWHGSPPTPLTEQYIQYLTKAGLPLDLEAPRGGQAMITISQNNGVTWSKPTTLIDTPYDDRHPSVRELSDGTLLCSFYTFPGPLVGSPKVDPSKGLRVGVIRSFDSGETWEQQPRRLPPVFMSESPGNNAPIVELADGSILQVTHAFPKLDRGGKAVVGVFRSSDSGTTWEYLSRIEADHGLFEPAIGLLKNGTLVVVVGSDRSMISWSLDDGRTWSKLVPLFSKFHFFSPSFTTLSDGTLLCIFGARNRNGHLQATFSTDGGRTWVAPSQEYGFRIDQTYGYSESCLMPDGSVYLTYLDDGGHSRKGAENNAIWSLRLRVRDDHSGIELLPVDNQE